MKYNECLYVFIFSQFRSIRQFAKQIGLHDQIVGDYLYLRTEAHSPYKHVYSPGSERFTKTALMLSEFMKIEPDTLFPAELYGEKPLLEQLPMSSYYSQYAREYQRYADPSRIIFDDEVRKFAIAMLRVLKPKEKFVICKRFIEGITLEECGENLGVSRQYVQQIEEKALRRLRKRDVLKLAEELI